MDVILILGVLFVGLVYFFYRTGKETGKVLQPLQTPIVKLGPEPEEDKPTLTVVEQPVITPAGEEALTPKKRTRKPAAKPAAMKAPAKTVTKKTTKKTK